MLRRDEPLREATVGANDVLELCSMKGADRQETWGCAASGGNNRLVQVGRAAVATDLLVHVQLFRSWFQRGMEIGAHLLASCVDAFASCLEEAVGMAWNDSARYG